MIPNPILQGIMENYVFIWGFPGGTNGKEPACQCRRLRDVGSIPGSGKSPGGGNGNLLQYSCLKNIP